MAWLSKSPDEQDCQPSILKWREVAPAVLQSHLGCALPFG